MGKKFDAIFEAVVSRYQVGGYLPGDLVKFRPNYKSSPTYNAMHSVMKQELDDLVNSGLNIKVVHVGDKFSGVTGGNQYKTADSAVITVAGDHGGGRWYQSISVTPEMIDIVGHDEFAPAVPEQFYRKTEEDYKPKKLVDDMTHPTRLTDKGDGKNTPSNTKLTGESVRMTNDFANMGALYESLGTETQKVIEEAVDYEKVLITEGLLRRIATKLTGGFKSNPLQKNNKEHTLAKSIAYEVGKDISKTFGGNVNTHVKNIYGMVLKYLQTAVP